MCLSLLYRLSKWRGGIGEPIATPYGVKTLKQMAQQPSSPNPRSTRWFKALHGISQGNDLLRRSQHPSWRRDSAITSSSVRRWGKGTSRGYLSPMVLRLWGHMAPAKAFSFPAVQGGESFTALGVLMRSTILEFFSCFGDLGVCVCGGEGNWASSQVMGRPQCNLPSLKL